MNARHFVAALAIAPIALVLPAAARPPVSEAAAARAEGTRLFRAKNFAAACPKFELAARLAPEDPEPLADLALCKQRLGDSGAAEDLNRKVIDLGSKDKALTDPRFARSRRHAYFNLSQLDKTEHRYFPKVAPNGCGELKAEVGCSKGLYFCTTSWTGGGSWRTADITRIRIAVSAEEARFEDDENTFVNEKDINPDFGELTQPFQPAPEVVENNDSLTYVESYDELGHEWRCDEQESWSCDSSAAVAAEAKKCPAPPAGTDPAAEACRKSACDRATKRPWPAVVKERKAAGKDQRECHAGTEKISGQYGCEVAYANACTGLVGLICSGHEHLKEKDRSRVEEYLFEPPDPKP